MATLPTWAGLDHILFGAVPLYSGEEREAAVPHDMYAPVLSPV